jgi:predicted CXXCH cytochrome family protein
VRFPRSFCPKHNKSILNVPPVRWIVIFIGFCLFMPSSSLLAAPGHAGLKPADAKACLNCHKDLAAPPPKGSVHPPFASGECATCHELNEDNTFKIVDTGELLCSMCHEPMNTEAAVHGPVATGDCVLCHSPHQSPNPKLLLAASARNLCFTCHDEGMAKHKFVHAPVAGGECLSCHATHQSPYAKQLVQEGTGLCLMCHPDTEEQLKKKHVHSAIKDVGCTGCHSPHGTENKYQLLKMPPELCYDCHSDKEEYVKQVKYPHGSMDAKASCVKCHDPHASDYDNQLKAGENIDLCLKCHGRVRKTPNGYVRNMKKWLMDNPEHHGPILTGDCAACHDPHGSNNWRMLRNAFPSTFYTPFKVKEYRLCFECHDKGLVLEKITTSATGFRNGEKNLHSVHVNDARTGRRCVVCHNVHASRGPKHVRESSRIGNWEIPLNFVSLEDGGRCAPGCHFPREYNRSKAVKSR